MNKFINKIVEYLAKKLNYKKDVYDFYGVATPKDIIAEDIRKQKQLAEHVKYMANDAEFHELEIKCQNHYEKMATKNEISLAVRTNSFATGNFDVMQGGGYINGGLNNNAVGLGSTAGRDFSNYDWREIPTYTFQQVWTTFYQTSPIAKRFIDLLTSSVMQNWVNFFSREKDENKKKKTIEAVEDYIEDNTIYLLFYVAIRQMFMHGGAALYIDTDDADTYQPLIVTKGKRIAFRLIDKSLMYPFGYNFMYNITDKNFNKPTHWSLSFGSGFVENNTNPIHSSRFIFFVPEELPFFARINQLWWGNSSLLSVRKYINIVDRGFHSTGNQIQQASMAFLKTRLMNIAVNPQSIPAYAQAKNAQFQAALVQNGSANIIEKDDEIERLEISNLEQQVIVTEKIINIICASEGMPPSIFYGSSSQGYTISDPELISWFATVEGWKTKYAARPLKELMNVINLSLFGNETEVRFKFNTINKPSETQQQDIFLKMAQKYAILKKTGSPNWLIARQMQRDGIFQDYTMEEIDKVIADMDKFDLLQMQTNSMEGKDIKDGLDKQKTPSAGIAGLEPEHITSEALYK